VRRSADVRIAFGGHRIDVVAGGNRSANPMWDPAR
jgi:hypothetical protein